MSLTKITKGTFSILTHKAGTKDQEGYLLGNVFGIHKSGKPWVVTHLASGLAIGVLTPPPPPEPPPAVTEAAARFDWSGKDIYEICRINKIEPRDLRSACYQINR